MASSPNIPHKAGYSVGHAWGGTSPNFFGTSSARREIKSKHRPQATASWPAYPSCTHKTYASGR